MDLTKMFVLVPSTSNATVESIKSISVESGNSHKVYFVEKYNQIVAKGTSYGVDSTVSKELTTLVNVVGGSVAQDGTVTVDFSGLNYYVTEDPKTIIGAIKAIDAALKGVSDGLQGEKNKLAASKTLDENYELTAKLKYVAASGGVAAHIALFNEDEDEIAGTKIPVSDIIGNGVLTNSSYDETTGKLILNFAQADGTTKPVEVNLQKMLDINDVVIDEDSKKYLETKLGTADNNGEQQFILKALVKKIVGSSESTNLEGLAEAKDVKTYVSSVISQEVADRNSAISDAINNLDVPSAKKGTNVEVTISETNGKVSLDSVVEHYATLTHTSTSSTPEVPATNTKIEVTGNDENLVKAKDLKAVAEYASDKVKEETHRVDKKITDTINALNVTETPVSESGEGHISFKYSETDGKVAINNLSATYAAHTKKASPEKSILSTGIVNATTLNSVLEDLWETYTA